MPTCHRHSSPLPLRLLAWFSLCCVLALPGCGGGGSAGGEGSSAPLPSATVSIDPATVVAAAPPAIYGYGGNIWDTPALFGAGLGDAIAGLPQQGLTRISLGDQILKYATSPADLDARLAANPLNAYIAAAAAHGARFLFILDGTPIYCSAHPSTAVVPGPDWPVFRMSPPADLTAWAAVVRTVVAYYNGTMHLNAYYEAWNEPSYYYYGTTAEFLDQYTYSVIGARQADPQALIGGPGLAEITSAGTAGDAATSAAQRLAQAGEVLSGNYFLQHFLAHAASTAVPELGLTRLPVDFLSWHSYYINPTTYYASVAPFARTALEQAGYPGTTPLITSEWNLCAVPPYPEGDLNANEVDAAYAMSSLIAMDRAGVARQAFQMYVDPGTPGYHGGLFAINGGERPGGKSLRLLTMVQGAQVRCTSDDPWVSATACVDHGTIYLVIAALRPTPRMITSSITLEGTLAHTDFYRSLVTAGLVAQVVAGQPLPEPYAGQMAAIQAEAAAQRDALLAKAAARPGDLSIVLDRTTLGGTATPVQRYLIDASHSPSGGGLYQDQIAWPEQGNPTLTVGANSVQLLVLRPAASGLHGAASCRPDDRGPDDRGPADRGPASRSTITAPASAAVAVAPALPHRADGCCRPAVRAGLPGR